jgi:hypothetical protein
MRKTQNTKQNTPEYVSARVLMNSERMFRQFSVSVNSSGSLSVRGFHSSLQIEISLETL